MPNIAQCERVDVLCWLEFIGKLLAVVFVLVGTSVLREFRYFAARYSPLEPKKKVCRNALGT